LDNEDVEYAPECHQICEALGTQSSFDSTLLSLRDNREVELIQRPSHIHTVNSIRSSWHSKNRETIELYPSSNPMLSSNISSCTGRCVDLEGSHGVNHPDAILQGNIYMEELRQEALARQRPAEYTPRLRVTNIDLRRKSWN
jgi:hypothetical protein